VAVVRPSRRWWPSIAASLAIFVGVVSWGLRSHDLPSPHIVQLSSERLVFQGAFSPDGGQIAFASPSETRDNGTSRGPGQSQGSPRWSPDGLTIAFDSMSANGHWDIWTIGIDGSGLRQITRDPADENMPSWSRDGRFIYYGSNRSGRYEIWRIGVADGAEKQLTDAGGFLPFESRDGLTLYLRARGGELLARPTAGGGERSIAACVDTWA
jgi:hypothetical protein